MIIEGDPIVPANDRYAFRENQPEELQVDDGPSAGERVVAAMGQWIGGHPRITLGAAACIGVVLGWWIKRK